MPNKKVKKATKPRKRLSRITPRKQQAIMDLADSLGLLLPATSRGEYCLQKIAKDNALAKFFKTDLGNKKKQFVYFIQQVHSRHPRKFKSLVNNILAEAVERRRSKGNPLLRDEADTLKSRLYELDIDLRREIDELSLPHERPKITPPPVHVKMVLEKFGLHPLLLESVLPLFSDGYLNEAVRKAGEIFEVYISKMSNTRGKYGRDLVTTVFSASNPIIDIAGYHKSQILNPIDEKEGYLYLAMGAMHWCKNITGHGDVDQLSPVDAASRVILISHLLEVVDSHSRNTEAKTP